MTDSGVPRTHIVVEGVTWFVTFSLLTSTELSRDLLDRLSARFKSRGIECHVGWASSENGEALTAAVLVDADTPGSAADLALGQVMSVVSDENVDSPVIHEAVIVPAWRDERDWSVS